MVCSGWRRLKGDPIVFFNILRGEKEGQVPISTLATSDETYRTSMNLSHRRLRLDIRRWFFIKRVSGDWNRLPKEVTTAPNLTELRKCLGNALKHTVGYPWGALSSTRRWI